MLPRILPSVWYGVWLTIYPGLGARFAEMRLARPLSLCVVSRCSGPGLALQEVAVVPSFAVKQRHLPWFSRHA